MDSQPESEHSKDPSEVRLPSVDRKTLETANKIVSLITDFLDENTSTVRAGISSTERKLAICLKELQKPEELVNPALPLNLRLAIAQIDSMKLFNSIASLVFWILHTLRGTLEGCLAV